MSKILPSTVGEELGGQAVIAPYLLSTSDACRFLSISRTTLHALINNGKIKPIKLGSSFNRFRVEDLRKIADGALDRAGAA